MSCNPVQYEGANQKKSMIDTFRSIAFDFDLTLLHDDRTQFGVRPLTGVG